MQQRVVVVVVDDDDLGQRGHARVGHGLMDRFWWFIIPVYILI